MNILRRDGREMPYMGEKICNAVGKANNEVSTDKQLLESQIKVIEEKVRIKLNNLGHTATVEEIQDMVIHEIMRQQAFEVAQGYTEFRFKQMLKRKKNTTDDNILSLIDYENEEIKQENSNKNPMIASTQRDYIAGEVSKDITWRILLPEEVKQAHEDGRIHFHDADYFLQYIYNCCLINLLDMLMNGTVITETQITKPKGVHTAANVATQIIAQVASNQYGGQTFSLAHLAPWVDISRQRLREEVREERIENGDDLDEEKINRTAERRLKKEIRAAIKTIQYQLVTLMTTNGQTPFVSMYMHIDEPTDEQTKYDLALLIEEVFYQRIKGLPNEEGKWITPAFPKLLYVLDESNAYEGSKYFYLTELAAQCTNKRMVPDYISAKKMREYTGGDVYGCMGCRSFLTVDRFADTVGNISNSGVFDMTKHHYYGRFNQGVVTINLVDAACASNGDMDKFWEILDDTLDICHIALQHRHNRLKGTSSDIAPILWQHGAIARLKKGEKIDKLLYNGYSTISLGYAGLYEMCMRMTGKSHTDPEARPFALAVMKHLNDKCNEWKAAENIDYSIYGTPLESTTYKFAKCLQKKYGIIKDVTDHGYITNSYHVNVREHIDAFEKLKFEAEFQELSPGGAISYVEIPNMNNNIKALIKMIQFVYENIKYAEFNSKSDYCHVCGFDGEIEIVEDANKKLIWKCPCCGNTDQNKMNVARRTCGYIGTQFWNQGRTEEIRDRVLHTDIMMIEPEDFSSNDSDEPGPINTFAIPDNIEAESKTE